MSPDPTDTARGIDTVLGRRWWLTEAGWAATEGLQDGPGRLHGPRVDDERTTSAEQAESSPPGDRLDP